MKTIPFRGGTQEWSNRYHFDGVLPPDSATWTVLADLLVADEAAIIPAYCTVVEAVGYGPGSDVPVFSKVYTTAGTLSVSGEDAQAPEVVALVKWQTSKRSSKNHPVYAFNYIHGVSTHSATELSWLLNGQKTAIGTYMTGWVTGYSDGSHTHHRTLPDGTLCTSATVENYVTHRDFPR